MSITRQDDARARRAVLAKLGWLVAACAIPTLVPGAPEPADRPNIILILADDMGYSDIGCFGSEIRTPNIDALAAGGLRFTNFYNGAVCCPTRAALLTGLYPHQAGVAWMVNHGADTRAAGPYQGYLNERCVTLAEVLRAAGYRTFMSGKWHVGESRPHWPTDRGFDRYYGLISGSSNYFDLTKDRTEGIVRQMAIDERPYDPPREGFFMTDAIADHAVRFVAEAARDEAPFFLYLAYTAPHCPLQALAENIASYRGRYRSGWDALRRERFERMKSLKLIELDAQLSPREPGIPAWTDISDPDRQDLLMAIYAAQMTEMDRGIGRVLDELRRSGREENTLILFLSDNGACPAENLGAREERLNRAPSLGGPESYEAYGRGWANASNTPLRKWKTRMHEGGIATPLIAVWPGRITSPGGITRAPGHVIDVMATLVEVARAQYPGEFLGRKIHPMEGTSFAPVLRGEPAPRRAPIFWEFEGNRAVRDGHWKLVADRGAAWELYNIDQDPMELSDLAGAMPARVRQMSLQYDAWTRRCGVRPWEEISPHLRNLPLPPIPP